MDSFTVGERESSLWRKVRGIIEKKLAACRQSLESPTDQDRTNILRGEIEAYKALLRLEEPPRDIPEDIHT